MADFSRTTSFSEVDVDPYNLIHNFQRLQEERASTYHMFEEGHKIYLKTGPQYNFTRFRTLVSEVTQDFKRISTDIIDIQRLLKQRGLDEVESLIAKVQEEEKNKLLLTADLQLAKQALQDAAGKERNIDLDGPPENIQEIKRQLQVVESHINELLEEIRYKASEHL